MVKFWLEELDRIFFEYTKKITRNNNIDGKKLLKVLLAVYSTKIENEFYGFYRKFSR